ncbi:FAD-dependent monooxygenase, partial [Vibrio parahaemolyticus]|nr:FAD-dependent monooxygenase [Vibrio parahaemolyticus]
LNTGVADAFNLIWKLSMVIKGQASPALLKSYHAERQPVAQSVIDSSGELVRSTKFSATNTHAQDYVKIVEKRSGNITGMGIRYSEEGLAGTRMWDFVLNQGTEITRLYSLLDYARWTLFLFNDDECVVDVPPHVHVIRIGTQSENAQHWTRHAPYPGQAVLVRPDAYIE